MMPEMDGFEFAERLREKKEWLDIPVVVITAKDLTKDSQGKEGFIGGSTLTTDFFIPTYQACRAQGYSREFCVQTPEEGSPGSCICDDGRRGKYLVGYRGQCVCDDHNSYQLAY